MKLADGARYYYTEKNNNCAVSILMAGSDKYGLGLTMEDSKLLIGFGGGMGCGSVCGALSGAIAVLGKMYADRSDLRSICAKFAKAFKAVYECDSWDCAVLAAKYKNKETRCEPVVVIAAELLEKYIESIE